MIDSFHAFLEWLEALPVIWAYASLLAVAYLENVVPPIPGDLVIVFGGYLAGIGMLHTPLVITVATVGGSMGFMSAYAFGRWIGSPERLVDRMHWIRPTYFRSAGEWLNTWGYWLILANRFLSGARSVIALSVGMSKVPANMVAICATISAAAWTTLIVLAGYLLGENWQLVGGILDTYGLILALVFFCLVIYFLTPWVPKRSFSKDPEKAEKEGTRTAKGS